MIDPDETIARPKLPDIAEAETIPPGESAVELVRILDLYMAAVQAGEAPDRARLLAEHPALAAQLEPCLAGIDFIHRAATPSGTESEPAMLGEFRIVREVGRGGMGVVYEAEQTSLRRRVALKVLRFGVVADDEAVRRFRVEAETVARLHHTNIVPIFAVGTEHDVAYYAMQFIEGQSLADVLENSRRQGQPIPNEDVAAWGLQAAEALTHAHQRRVIHRDIKPSNLLIDLEGVIWLTDFGLAKRSDEVTLTLSGTLMGTPRYMSPEQAEAMKRPVDHRTDLYSLGASLYELVTGRPVFESSTAHGVIMQILTAEPVAPRTIRPEIPRDLETILLTCLAKDPDRRYATAQALAEDLRSFLEGRAIKARRTPLWEKAARLAKRQKKSAAIGAIAAAASVLVAGGALAFWQSNEAAKLGKLSLSTQGEPLTAEVLLPDRDERVGDPFTVPTRSPVPVPEGDYRVRLTAPGKLSETYQLRLERWLAQDFQVDLSKRDLWASSKQEPTRRDWRAYPLAVGGRTDLVEVDWQSVSRVTALREPVWSFKITDQSQLTPGLELKDWGNLLLPRIDGSRYVEQLPGVLGSMPDLNGDGIGDVVISSRQKPAVFALSGKDGKILWHHWLPTESLPKPNPWGRVVGQPLVIERAGGPMLVVTFDLGFVGNETVETRRVQAIDGRTGLEVWHHATQPHHDRVIPAQKLRVAGRDVVSVISGENWVRLDPDTGSPTGPSLELDQLLPTPPEGSSRRPLRQPSVVDLDGDGSDDLLVLNEGLDANHPVLMAISSNDRRLLWSIVVESAYPRGGDLADPEAIWPQVADLDGDGRPEILVPYQLDIGPVNLHRKSIGLRAIEGKDGRVRWSHRTRNDWDVDPQDQFVAGPDVDGDGVRDVFRVEVQPDELPLRGNLNQSTLYVDALSGRDGRSLWWWSRPILSELLAFQLLRWWEPGPDGLPKLVVDTNTDMAFFRDFPRVFVLEATTGRLLHEAANFHPTGSADLNGDGIPELWGFSADRSDTLKVRRVVAFGRPPEVWKRLGRWVPGRDYNGDGVPDLVGPESGRHNEVEAISGLDGHLLWRAAPDLSRQYIVNESPSFHPLPLPEKLGDLDGDGVPEVALTRELGSNALRNKRLTVGLGICSGRTGKILWENPEVPWDDRYPTWLVPCNVLTLDVEGQGRADILTLLHVQGSRLEGKVFVIFGEFHLARFSGATGRLIAMEKIQVRNEGPQQNDGLPVRDFPNAVADLDGDGSPEIVFLLPRRSTSGQQNSDFVAVSTSDAKVVWRHPGAMAVDQLSPLDDAWKRFAAADINGDGKSEVVLVDVVENKPGVELWDLSSSRSAPRWIWQGSDQDGGKVVTVSAIPRVVKVKGANRKEIVLIADQEKAGRRVVVLDAEGRVARARPIESNVLGHQIWAGDLDGDGQEELLFQDRDKMCASRSDLTTDLWASATFGHIQEIHRVARGKTVIDIGNGNVLDGTTGRTISPLGWISSSRLIDGPDPSRPLVLEVENSQTTVHRILPPAAASISVVTHPVRDDPRVVRPLPWVVGSPGGLGESQRSYLPWLGLFALAAGGFSFAVLVGPMLMTGRMIRGKGKVKDLLILTVSVAVALAAYLLFRSEWMSRSLGQVPPSSAVAMVVTLAVLGVPCLAIVVQIVQTFRRRRLRSLPAVLLLWVAGSVASASLLIYIHHREWMGPGERYGWEGWWTIWLPGLYVAGCLLIAWKILSWPVKRVIRSRRAVA